MIYENYLIILIYIYFFKKIKKVKEINKDYYYKNYKNNKNEISKKNLIFPPLNLAAEVAKNFINNSINGVLYNKKNFTKIYNPKISVVIPVYNNEKIIKRTLSSILNQNMINFEIILVNDFSKDNSSLIIKNIQNNDNRIILINNNKNMGTLYSRCIGVLVSKGEYILPLDNDDMFLDRDVFEVIYNEAIERNFDIVKFNGIEVKGIENFFKNKYYKILYTNYNNNFILYQPELSFYPIKRKKYFGNYVMEDAYLWSKCIKAELYKKAVSLYSKKKYITYMTSWEDCIINFIIFQIANSFKYITKYGILRISIFSSANHVTALFKKNTYEIYFLDTVFEYSKNTYKGKEVILNLIFTLVHRPFFYKTLNVISTKNYFKFILKKIFNSKFIIEKDKQSIKKLIFKYKLFR